MVVEDGDDIDSNIQINVSICGSYICSCLGRLNTITSFTLCSQSGAAGCRECEVELSRVCHDVTRRSVTEMETVTRAGHWTPAHCATAIVDSSSLQQICCG